MKAMGPAEGTSPVTRRICRWTERIFAIIGVATVITLLVFSLTYGTVPRRNTKLSHFDTIIVLGSPATRDGAPSPEQRERVLEGVRKLRAGRADHMILSGGAVENQFIEAQVMAELAADMGVPSAAPIMEGKSQNTIENIFYSRQIMVRNGWTSAEIVSSSSHLPRAGLILEHYTFQWRTHAARWPPEFGWEQLAMHYGPEIIDVTLLRWRGFVQSRFLP